MNLLLPTSSDAAAKSTQSESTPVLCDKAGAALDPKVSLVLDQARWAPSGDNTQPWRFEAIGQRYIMVHGRDTRDHCVYDLDGRASQQAIGAMLETLSIAASTYGWRADIERLPEQPDTQPTFSVRFVEDPAVTPDPLADVIQQRVTQRRCMRTKPLTQQQRDALWDALPPGFTVHFLGSAADRRRMAKLLFDSAKIRLITREAYEVHRSVIEWKTRFSDDRIPDQAVGLNPMSLPLMRWAMKKWSRIQILNRFFAGTVLPRVELDFLPGYFCGAHFFILADNPPRTLDDMIAAGRALQRFWLTATRVGLQFQPAATPMIFSNYVRDNVTFTNNPAATTRAQQIAQRLGSILGPNIQDDAMQRLTFMGRLGHGKTPRSRSLRLPMNELMKGE